MTKYNQINIGDLIKIKFKFCIKYPAYLFDTYMKWGSISLKSNALITVKEGQEAQFVVIAKENEELVLLVNNTFLIKANLANIDIIEDNPVSPIDKLKNILENDYDFTAEERVKQAYEYLENLQSDVENSNEQPSLIKNYNDHPEWCKNNKSLEYFENFRLGEFIWYNGDRCQIIHIGYNGINEAPSFRLKLNSGASITGHYNYISKN